ncbi:thioesterase II family protein [Nocardia goodfellowii]
MSRSSPWLTDVVSAPGPVLYCVPHAGATSLAYRQWGPFISEGTALSIAALPGRGRRIREPLARDASEIIEPLGAAIADRGRNFLLFGHSMGALIAFGTTQWLRDNGYQGPEVLVVSGSPAPHIPKPINDPNRLGDAEFEELVRRIGGLPENVLADPAMRQHALGLLRADFGVAHSFQPRLGTASCPILALHATGDTWVRGQDVQEWAAHTSSEFRYAELSGDHFAPINDAPGFVANLNKSLERF